MQEHVQKNGSSIINCRTDSNRTSTYMHRLCLEFQTTELRREKHDSEEMENNPQIHLPSWGKKMNTNICISILVLLKHFGFIEYQILRLFVQNIFFNKNIMVIQCSSTNCCNSIIKFTAHAINWNVYTQQRFEFNWTLFADTLIKEEWTGNDKRQPAIDDRDREREIDRERASERESSIHTMQDDDDFIYCVRLRCVHNAARLCSMLSVRVHVYGV